MRSDILPLGLGRFAKGATEYADYYPEAHVKDVSRIVMHIYPANRREPLPVIVDTAAPWCVFDPPTLIPDKRAAFSLPPI